ncbi:MAG: hypothetical protein OJF49_002795 [Ktedonobacterales bacterium]|jgi:Uma2 family endonuclease|nr:MAG: hypothetical protein OJF49_002795 [Ktedonobacterales bacterium]
MSAVPKQHLLTAEQFAALPREGLRLELIRGEMLAMPPAFGGHGKTSMRLGVVLGQYVIAHSLGEVYAAETGFLVARNPDTVRAPDVAFIQTNRVPPREMDNEWVPVIPDLVAEVVSNGDRSKDVAEKVQMWLEVGVRLVLVARPPERVIEVHRPNEPVLTLHDGDTLEGYAILPSFAAPVASFFG